MKCVSPLAGDEPKGEVPEICHSDTQTGHEQKTGVSHLSGLVLGDWVWRARGSFLHMQIMLLRTCITHLLTIVAAIAASVWAKSIISA